MHMASLQPRVNLWVGIRAEDETSENVKLLKFMENIE